MRPQSTGPYACGNHKDQGSCNHHVFALHSVTLLPSGSWQRRCAALRIDCRRLAGWHRAALWHAEAFGRHRLWRTYSCPSPRSFPQLKALEARGRVPHALNGGNVRRYGLRELSNAAGGGTPQLIHYESNLAAALVSQIYFLRRAITCSRQPRQHNGVGRNSTRQACANQRRAAQPSPALTILANS